ncbi:MAG: TIM barrel protein [Novosphingobium sp.]|nr:TIM barrel protein [Novosphingobium sp.]
MFAFGVDLITFFDPGFWSVDSEDQIIALAAREPRRFWTTILDTLCESGVDGLEFTFAPFAPEGLVEAFGGFEAAQQALIQRKLSVASGFMADLALSGLGDAANVERMLATGDAYAAALAAWGGKALVLGLPMRRSWDAQPPLFVDLDTARPIADFCNRLGAITLRHGVRLALHPEAHSMFCHARDIDLFMMLTDPVYVGFCPDSAHLLLSGGDPVAIATRHAERLITAHWKDAISAMPVQIPVDAGVHHAHRKYFCALGEGTVDLEGWAKAMAGTLGGTSTSPTWAILEIDAVADPLCEIRQSLVTARRLVGERQRGVLA